MNDDIKEVEVIIRLKEGWIIGFEWVKEGSSKAMFKQARDKFLADWDIPEEDKKVIRKYLKVKRRKG